MAGFAVSHIMQSVLYTQEQILSLQAATSFIAHLWSRIYSPELRYLIYSPSTIYCIGTQNDPTEADAHLHLAISSEQVKYNL